MYFCGQCRAPFLSSDEMDLAALPLPPPLAALKPLAAPYVSRLLLFRCPSDTCGGLVTAIYRPRTPAPGAVAPGGKINPAIPR